MRTLSFSIRLFLAFLLMVVTGISARADSTWITGPTLSSISFVSVGATKTSSGVSLSSQVSDFTLVYTGGPTSAGKFAQVNFFDVSTGLKLGFASTALASPTGCSQQVLAGDTHSCMFKLDSAGEAAIKVNVVGASTAASFKYLLLSGPNIAQTQPGSASFSDPKCSVKALASSVKALSGGASVLRFKLAEGAVASVGVKVNIKLKGIGDNLSAMNAISDAKGLVWVYVANTSGKKGLSTVTVSVVGTTAKGEATIKWVAGSLGN